MGLGQPNAPMGFVPDYTVASIRAASEGEFYQDDPGSLGSGTYAQSFPVRTLDLKSALVINSLSGRVEFPAAAGESATIALFRFRKPAPFGPFILSQITDAFVIDATSPWSWTIREDDEIRPGFQMVKATDSLAVSNVYVAGGGPTMRALRIDFDMAPAPGV